MFKVSNSLGSFPDSKTNLKPTYLRFFFSKTNKILIVFGLTSVFGPIRTIKLVIDLVFFRQSIEERKRDNEHTTFFQMFSQDPVLLSLLLNPYLNRNLFNKVFS